MKAGANIDIHELLAKRRSPRSLDAGAEIGRGDLIAILEAARWAPSASNIQPWRFVIGVRGEEVFTEILEAHHRNYVAHQMASFDRDKANAFFQVKHRL